ARVATLACREVHGDALARLCLLDRLVVTLDAPNADGAAARLEPQEVAAGDRARPERSCDDSADAAEREGAVDPEAGCGEPLGALDGLGGPRDRRTQLVQAGPGLGADRGDLGLRDGLARLGHGELDLIGVDRVGLRHRRDNALDAAGPPER